ncbi:MAG: DUF1573 domain-containing protein [Candidatus Cryptobacteroides sp.]
MNKLGLVMLFSCVALSAQIRIVPREQLELQLSEDAAALSFDSREVTLPALSEDSQPVSVVFAVHNVSSRPVYLTRLASSCSCLKVEAPQAASGAGFLKLAPGESTEIRAVYDPQGHPGKFSRRISVYTAASEDLPAAVLTVNADVAWSSNPEVEFPVRCGNLLLARREVELSGKAETIAIRCCNASGKPVKLSCDTAFLPFPVEMSCNPQVLQPGQKGRIVLEIEAGSAAAGKYPLILKGCGARPGESGIILKIK